MIEKICIFAGTTEGRKLAETLKNTADVTVCVATEYGETVLDNIENIKIHKGRMDEAEMESFFVLNGFDRIIDATHPYASVVTENIFSAAGKLNVPAIRILRESEKHITGAVYVSSVKEAAKYLEDKSGNVFVTTGAKELDDYNSLDMSRVWARVLPSVSSLEACEKAGVPVAHVIAAQGPFSYGVNLEQLKSINAKYLVTKSSGKSGGFEEKIRAAADAGAVPVIIGQPEQVNGITLEEAISLFSGKTDDPNKKIYIIGIGPGNEKLLTEQAKEALEECDAVIGASSVIKAIKTPKPCFAEYDPAKVRQILDENAFIKRAAIVMRGDTGFFSGAKNMLKEFKGGGVTVIPGVSSVCCLSAKTGVSYDDAAIVSLHGRYHNIVHTVNVNKKTFALCGGENGVKTVLEKLCEYGFSSLFGTVGEKLSLDDEKITSGTLTELAKKDYDPLSVLFIENPDALNQTRAGIPDDEFIRAEVPMTKAEVRAISLSKLSLKKDSVVWDIGAGTGSVSVECALNAPDGLVFAIEKEDDAAELIRQNKIKFRADNVVVIKGTAPEALLDLPTPTHVFIGGSSGRLSDILSVVLNKNAYARIVINTITLESQVEALECAKKYGFSYFDAVSASISRSKKVGRYNMMLSQNPVFVFTLLGGKASE